MRDRNLSAFTFMSDCLDNLGDPVADQGSDLAEATQWALCSIAESLHEANIESRARDMIDARVRIFDQWAESTLRKMLTARAPTEEIVQSFRDALATAIAPPF